MYCRQKSSRPENHKPKKTHRNSPSFSSTLLDEICRSIDGNGGSPEDFEAVREIPASGFRAKSSSSSSRDEKMAGISRACLVEKWMEKELNEKIVARRRPTVLPESENSVFPDNEFLFFSSNSSSSDSSGVLSSSDTEFFSSTTKSKVSCSVKRPKPVRTGVSARENYELKECVLFDDAYQKHGKEKVEDDLIKSKSRALKIYANLKKMKQPISPGGRLTSLINSVFANMNRKKSKNIEKNTGFQEQSSPDHQAAASMSSTCSSASSFSRSCLSKNPPKSREKVRNGIERTVRFHPVGVIVDQDSKPCGQKSIYDEVNDHDKYGRPPLPPNALKVRNRRKGGFSMFSRIWNEEDDADDDDDEDDAFSESSSDLFELDHLSLFGNDNRYREELPVYETTYLDKNHGLIR